MYQDYFGLQEEPFSITPDPRYLFFSRKHRDAYSSLVYGIESRRGFIQLTGEVGAGKTTLCRAVLEKIQTHTHTSLILNPKLSELLLLQAIIDDFGIPVSLRDKKDCFDALNKFLLDEFHKGYNSVLVIDEAQNLTPETLEQIRLLSNLETSREKLLQIVLIGQPELRETLNDPTLAQLRQRITVRFHLTPLSRVEMERYIEHRLHVAGWSERMDAPFLDGALDYIYDHTGGVPRLINSVCDFSLLAAYARGVRQVDRELVHAAINEIEGVPVA